MAQDLPFWRPLPAYDPQQVTLDLSATAVEPYVAPYTAPAAGSVALDFWGAYRPDDPGAVPLAFEAVSYRYTPPAASAVDLDFAGDYTAPTAGDVALAFGDAGAPPAPAAARQALAIDATLALPGAFVTLAAVNPLRVAATPRAPGAQVTLASDIHVHRAPTAQAGDHYQQAARHQSSSAARSDQSARRRRHTATRYQQADAAQASHGQRSRAMPRRQARRQIRAEQAAPLGHQTRGRNAHLPRQPHHRRLRAEQARALHAAGAIVNVDLPHRRRQRAERGEQATPRARYWYQAWQTGVWSPTRWTAPFEQARWPPPGISVPPGHPPVEPEPPWPELPAFYRGSPDLDFCAPQPTPPYALVFGIDPCAPPPAGPIQIPTRRIYIVQNSAQLVRVADGRDIPAAAVTLAIDADSWSWSLSATLAGAGALALVEGSDGAPIEIDALINGHGWRVLIDGWQLQEAWQRGGGTIRGRSRAAYLAAPYAQARDYTEESERTAQQLAAQELPPGWTLDWQLPDWLVPAGAWSYQGLAPIDALSRIAAAGGGYVQAHPSDDTVRVQPRYPAAPWDWPAQAEVLQLPRDVLLARGSDKAPGDRRNAVYVHGHDPGGILARVVRTGTAGDRLAETIVDPLITDPIPARARGIAALAATGRQATETHELPLSASLGGLILPGRLLAAGTATGASFAGDWRGLVRGVSVSASATRAANGGAALSVRQRLTIERHYEEA